MDDNETADVLDRAADELLMRGWTQGALEDGAGRVCALGALLAADLGAVRIGQDLTPVGNRAFAVLGEFVDAAQYDTVIAGWNNDPDRTEDEVHDALRGCAKELRERAAGGRVGS